MNVICFEDAIKLLESGQPILVRYVSYDKRRKTGGHIKEHEVMIIKKKSDHVPANVAKITSEKAQNHYDNFTRNCYQCIDGQPTMNVKRIHLPLMLQVNKMKVML